MKGWVTADEWFSLALLLILTTLMPLAGNAGPFFYWTAAGTALLGIVALCNAGLRRELILLGFLLPVALLVTTAANHAVLHVTRRAMDGELLHLGHGFSLAFYRWVLAHKLCWIFLNQIYYALPFFGAVVVAVSPRRTGCAWAWVLAALIAPLFYVVFPATGPAAHLGDPNAPRNCIPSLHMTWAMLCVVYMRPRLRWTAIVFAGLTALATLGIGEHYLIDLVVAVPYTWGICRLERGLRKSAVFHRERRAGAGVRDAEEVSGNGAAIALQASSR